MQKRVFAMGAVDVVGTLLDIGVASSTQASAVWTISTITAGIVEIQDSIRTSLDGKIMTRVIDLLGSRETQVFWTNTRTHVHVVVFLIYLFFFGLFRCNTKLQMRFTTFLFETLPIKPQLLRLVALKSWR